MKKRVLVICVHNSARSQIAEEYIRLYGGDTFEAESAGLEPGELNPNVVKVLQEEGIDISEKKAESVFEFFKQGRTYHHVITVCSKEVEEKCPVFPGLTIHHNWPYPDPAELTGTDEEILAGTREIRDLIKEKVKDFVKTEDMENAEQPFQFKGE